jgi:hypothetical protein
LIAISSIADSSANIPGASPGARIHAGEVEQMLALGVVELQRPRDRIQHALGGAADVAALQLGVVVEADVGEHGDLFAPQAGHAAFTAEVGQAGLRRGEVRAAGDQEFPQLVFLAHDLTVDPSYGPAAVPRLPGRAGLLRR